MVVGSLAAGSISALGAGSTPRSRLLSALARTLSASGFDMVATSDEPGGPSLDIVWNAPSRVQWRIVPNGALNVTDPLAPHFGWAAQARDTFAADPFGSTLTLAMHLAPLADMLGAHIDSCNDSWCELTIPEIAVPGYDDTPQCL